MIRLWADQYEGNIRVSKHMAERMQQKFVLLPRWRMVSAIVLFFQASCNVTSYASSKRSKSIIPGYGESVYLRCRRPITNYFIRASIGAVLHLYDTTAVHGFGMPHTDSGAVQAQHQQGTSKGDAGSTSRTASSGYL